MPIWRTAVVDCHRHSPQTSESVCICVCVLLCHAVSSTTASCLTPPTYLPSPSPCSKRVHTRVLDVPISSSDAKQKISACCTLLLPRPLHLPTSTPPLTHHSSLCTLLKPNQRSRKVKCDADYPVWGKGKVEEEEVSSSRGNNCNCNTGLHKGIGVQLLLELALVATNKQLINVWPMGVACAVNLPNWTETS